jgi:hypothetical protein
VWSEKSKKSGNEECQDVAILPTGKGKLKLKEPFEVTMAKPLQLNSHGMGRKKNAQSKKHWRIGVLVHFTFLFSVTAMGEGHELMSPVDSSYFIRSVNTDN